MSSATFDEVYEEAFPILYRIAYRITLDAEMAEDMTQEAFIRLFKREIAFPNKDEAKYWLVRVVKNLCFNHVKRKGRERRAMERVGKEPSSGAPTSEDEILKKEARSEIQEAVDKLPEKLRAALVLREFGDLSYREIAKILKISESNVKVRIYRARTKLEEILSREGIDVS